MIQAHPQQNTITYQQFRWKAAQFLISNAISIGVIIYELSSLNVCFDGYEGYDDDDYEDLEDDGTESTFKAALVFGLVMEIIILFSLSIIYRSFLDGKSAYLIPRDSTHCWGSFVARVFVPCGTGLTGILMGVVAINFAFNKSCDGNGGSTSSTLLLIVAVLSILFGIYSFALFLVLSTCSCCKVRVNDVEANDVEDKKNCCDTCCLGIRGFVHTGLKYVWVVDTVWQLLSVIISYRAGTFSVGIAWLVAFMTVFAEWRAIAASLFVIAYDNDFVTFL